MYEDSILKIWGLRKRLLLLPQAEIDLLTLKSDTFCSWHNHNDKANYFHAITATVRIKTSLGSTTLCPGESLTVPAGVYHRFEVIEEGIMLEVAYVKKGNIDIDDIDRLSQGGKRIEGKELTLVELAERDMLDKI